MSDVGGAREQLEGWLHAGLAAVEGGRAVARALARRGDDLYVGDARIDAAAPVSVLALGKAAAPMAAAAARILGDRLARGLIVTKQGHGAAVPGFTLREAGHPVPDAASQAAGLEALSFVSAGAPDEALLVLLSGGTSALTTAPLPGLDLPTLAATTDLLLRAGADIIALNTVRKALTRVSGGRLAEAAGGRSIDVLVISDVPGDAIEIIGSGPCAPDARGFREAWEVTLRMGLREELPAAVRSHLEAGAAAGLPCGPAPDSLPRCRHHRVASAADAAAAIAQRVVADGARAVRLDGFLDGEARDVADRLIERARSEAPGCCLIASGETTVTVRGDGRGGRNQELALAAAIGLDRMPGGWSLLAAGTDGTDGPTEAAGAYADAETCGRARALGLDAAASLARNDSHPFFAREGGLLVTGPTDTNVMDLVLLWIPPRI